MDDYNLEMDAAVMGRPILRSAFSKHRKDSSSENAADASTTALAGTLDMMLSPTPSAPTTTPSMSTSPPGQQNLEGHTSDADRRLSVTSEGRTYQQANTGRRSSRDSFAALAFT